MYRVLEFDPTLGYLGQWTVREGSYDTLENAQEAAREIEEATEHETAAVATADIMTWL